MHSTIFSLLVLAAYALSSPEPTTQGYSSNAAYGGSTSPAPGVSGSSAAGYDSNHLRHLRPRSDSTQTDDTQTDYPQATSQVKRGRRREHHNQPHGVPTPDPNPTPNPMPNPPPPNTHPTGGRPQRQTSGPRAKVIEDCSVPGTVAITFDDGPALTTHTLLDDLEKYPDVRVTFFVNGNNYVDASEPQYQAVMARAFNAGHQIASHTYQHLDLTTLDTPGMQTQITKNDDVIYSAIGRLPRYFRPPYGSVNNAVLDFLGSIGLVVVTWDEDTEDWQTHNADKSFALYQTALSDHPTGGFIVLEHDPEQSTSSQLMDMVIPAVRAKGLRMVTVAECLGDSQPYL